MKIVPSIKKTEVNLSGKCNIKIRISHNSKTRYIGTRFYILPEEWNINGTVVTEHPLSGFMNIELRKLCIAYEEKLMHLNYDVLTANRIVELLTAKTEINDFTAHYKRFQAQKATINAGTAELYYRTLNKIQSFDSRNPLTFEDINVGWLKRFEASMKKVELKKNAIAIHLRNIRAVFNNAIDENVIPLDMYPFRRFKISHEETEKRSITLEEFKAIRDYETSHPIMDLARNIWLLSFYLIGINSADLFELSTITGNNRLVYTRAKTHRKYSVKVEPEAKILIEKLKGKERLLSLSEQFKTVHDMTQSLNKALKRIGIVEGLTIYHARHTWSTFAKTLCKAPIENIGEALGHTRKTVTEIYVKRDPKVIDDLNRQVLDAVK